MVAVTGILFSSRGFEAEGADEGVEVIDDALIDIANTA